MPLSSRTAPCAFCLREAGDEINEQTGEPVGIAAVNLSEITPTSRTCVKCIQHFCPDHASPVDQVDCCYECLPFEAVTEMKTPLVAQDEEGNKVLRKGYRLVPTGIGYKTLPAAIADMNDAELEAYITEKANQIHQVERQRDYLRIAKSTAQLEQGERELAAQRALRGVKITLRQATGIKITGNSKTAGGAKGVSMPGNLDVADFLKFAAARMSKPGIAPAAKASQSNAPGVVVAPVSTAKPPKAGEVVGASSPVPVVDAKELAREAEIEAILDGGDVISEAIK